MGYSPAPAPTPSPHTQTVMDVGSSSPATQRPPQSFSLASPLLPVPAEILQANDNLTQVINLYKQLVRGEEVNGDATAGSIPGEKVGQESWEGTHQAGGAQRVQGAVLFSELLE